MRVSSGSALWEGRSGGHYAYEVAEDDAAAMTASSGQVAVDHTRFLRSVFGEVEVRAHCIAFSGDFLVIYGF